MFKKCLDYLESPCTYAALSWELSRKDNLFLFFFYTAILVGWILVGGHAPPVI